jgi:hypothetical protein
MGQPRSSRAAQPDTDRSAVLLEGALVVFGAGLLVGILAAIIGWVAELNARGQRQGRTHQAGSVAAERHRNVRATAAR